MPSVAIERAGIEQHRADPCLAMVESPAQADRSAEVVQNQMRSSNVQRVENGDGKSLGVVAFDYDGDGFVDLAVAKTFPIRERLKIEYRADFFNLLNHTNFAVTSGSRSMNSGQFGLLSSSSRFNGGDTGGPRVIQMTARLRF